MTEQTRDRLHLAAKNVFGTLLGLFILLFLAVPLTIAQKVWSGLRKSQHVTQDKLLQFWQWGRGHFPLKNAS